MTPKLRIRRRRSSSRRGEAGPRHYFVGLASLVTAFLLAVILVTGPLILGAARLWVELPLLVVVALLLVIQGLRLTGTPAPDLPRRADAIDLAVLLFVLYAVARWLTSPAGYFSRIEVMDVAAYAGIFFTCRYGMANRRYCMALLYLLVALGVVETALGYYLIDRSDYAGISPQDRWQPHYVSRWMGTYDDPNHYASLLIMSMGAALALGSLSKLAWPARIVLIYGALMMIVGVIYSGSWGGWIALLAAIGALVVVALRNGTMRWWVPVTGAGVLLATAGFLFYMSPVVEDRLASAETLIFEGKLPTEPRVKLAVAALRTAHHHLLFGTGPGTFAFVHPGDHESAFPLRADLVHDDFLNCLDDYGLVGLGLALFFMTAVTLKFFRPLIVDNRWQDRVLVATGFAAWVALLIDSLIDFNLHIPANALLLFSLTGLALGRVQDEKKAHWSTVPLAPLGRWLGVIIAVVALVYGVEVARTALSDHAYEKALARENEASATELIQAAGEALSYDRGNARAWALLGDLHRSEASRQKNSGDRLSESQKALDGYQNALQANSLDGSVQARIGLTLDAMQKYPEALSHYLEAVTAQPDNGQFWSWLAEHYRESGMPDQAAQAEQRAAQCPNGAGESPPPAVPPAAKP